MAADGSRFNFVGAAAVASGRVSADTALVPPDAVGDDAAVPLSGAQVANQVLLQVRQVPPCSSDSVTWAVTRKHGPVLKSEACRSLGREHPCQMRVGCRWHSCDPDVAPGEVMAGMQIKEGKGV